MVAALEAAPESDQRLTVLRHLRLSEDTFDEFTERLTDLIDELAARGDPDAEAADLAIAFFRPNRPPPPPSAEDPPA